MIRRCASAGFTPLKRCAQAGIFPLRRWFTYTLFWLSMSADDNLYGFDDEDYTEIDDAAWGEPIPYELVEAA